MHFVLRVRELSVAAGITKPTAQLHPTCVAASPHSRLCHNLQLQLLLNAKSQPPPPPPPPPFLWPSHSDKLPDANNVLWPYSLTESSHYTELQFVHCFLCKLCCAVQTAVKQELKKANAAAAVTQMSVAGMGGEEQGAAVRGSPDNDGTGAAARKSEKVR